MSKYYVEKYVKIPVNVVVEANEVAYWYIYINPIVEEN